MPQQLQPQTFIHGVILSTALIHGGLFLYFVFKILLIVKLTFLVYISVNFNTCMDITIVNIDPE